MYIYKGQGPLLSLHSARISVLPDNCPIDAKLLIFKAYLICGITTTAY